MPLSAAQALQAIAQAEAEGLMLVRSSKSATGFLGVVHAKPGRTKPYQAELRRDGKKHSPLTRLITCRRIVRI